MLPVEHKLPENVTTFEKEQENGHWKVVVRRDGKFIRETYCLTEEHADILRGQFIDLFWGKQLN